ncbi:MAG: hypothetical protein EHM70_16630 [Chloroflexota bacterium]|nr:MAG: hypothetical protein EHM70_16630 [Chloroflexota bacterium]
MKLAHIYRAINEIRKLPRVEIRLWGDDLTRHIYQNFTQPHPRYKLIRHKTMGVALVKLPATFQEYLAGKPKQALRTNRKHTQNGGYSFKSFCPMERIEEILEINKSSPVRQGREMHASYTNIKGVKEFAANKTSIYGVFNREGILRAYAYTPICGEVFIFSRLLGHMDDLETGTMYLLVSEVMREMIDVKRQTGNPRWGMYDTFFGAAPGLRYFKQRLGFQPHIVKWRWVDQEPTGEDK